MHGTSVFLAAALALAGCGGGARDVDYPPSRGISADIDASHQTNSPIIKRGDRLRSEPYDAFPWQLDERHPVAR
ncbi:MAG TPA: hypothetical protein VF502_19325 [Stellaceae bacterium]